MPAGSARSPAVYGNPDGAFLAIGQYDLSFPFPMGGGLTQLFLALSAGQYRPPVYAATGRDGIYSPVVRITAFSGLYLS